MAFVSHLLIEAVQRGLIWVHLWRGLVWVCLQTYFSCLHALSRFDEAVAIPAEKQIQRALTKAISQFCTCLGTNSNSFDTVVLSHKNQPGMRRHLSHVATTSKKKLIREGDGFFFCLHGLCSHRDLVWRPDLCCPLWFCYLRLGVSTWWLAVVRAWVWDIHLTTSTSRAWQLNFLHARSVPFPCAMVNETWLKFVNRFINFVKCFDQVCYLEEFRNSCALHQGTRGDIVESNGSSSNNRWGGKCKSWLRSGNLSFVVVDSTCCWIGRAAFDLWSRFDLRAASS